jgi:Transglutaminase-like superfamily
MKNIFTVLFILLVSVIFAQKNWQIEAQKAIGKSNNKAELEKILVHYGQKSDSLKLKAACFLIANMEAHNAYNYYWADSLEQKIEYDELAYSDFNASLDAFETLKKQKGKVHPIPTISNDLDNIKSEFLIENIDQAFSVWKPSQYDFETFCEYILPYRIDIEPLQNWRTKYQQRFLQIIENQQRVLLNDKVKTLSDSLNKWFVCTYHIEERNEPLPRLGALQLLHRKKGGCEDEAALTALALRSAGIPATTDVVPFWATSTGGHTLNSTFDTQKKSLHFDVLSLDSIKDFVREPAKVLRMTFSKQENTLASQVSKSEIPAYGLLQSQTYIDVTHEYWETRDLPCKIYAQKAIGKVIYASVLNGGKWRPAWWAKSSKDSVVFTNMCKGAVFLPQIYENNKLIPVGYPIVSGYNKIVELKPETNLHTISIKEQDKYLKFRPNKTYKLMFYDKGWQLLGEKTANESTKELIFQSVPKNALLILIPDYGQRKERPFVITDEGERLWW